MVTYRNSSLVTWYAERKDRCQATTLAELQCIFSATYEAKPNKGPAIPLCKMHSQMTDLPVRLITVRRRIQIRDE